MKAKILTLLLGLAVLGYAPLMAQVPEEELPQEQPPVTEEQPPAEAPPVEETEEPMATEPLEQEDPAAAEQEELGLQTDEEGAAEEELPATASPLPLIALLGAAGVASAAWVRLRRKQ